MSCGCSSPFGAFGAPFPPLNPFAHSALGPFSHVFPSFPFAPAQPFGFTPPLPFASNPCCCPSPCFRVPHPGPSPTLGVLLADRHCCCPAAPLVVPPNIIVNVPGAPAVA